MFGRRKKYEKKISNDRGDIASYATTVLGLKIYANNNERVVCALDKLKKKFSRAMPNAHKASAKILNDIEKEMEKLTSILKQPEWEEDDIINQINVVMFDIDRYLAEGVRI